MNVFSKKLTYNLRKVNLRLKLYHQQSPTRISNLISEDATEEDISKLSTELTEGFFNSDYDTIENALRESPAVNGSDWEFLSDDDGVLCFCNEDESYDEFDLEIFEPEE